MVLFFVYSWPLLWRNWDKNKKSSGNQDPVTIWNHDSMDMKQGFLYEFSKNVAKRSVELAEKEQADKVRKEINTTHLKTAIEQILKEELDKINKTKSS